MALIFLKTLDESFQPDEIDLLYEAAVEEGLFRDAVNTGLDVVGLIPGVGEFADAINAVIYLTETPPNYLFAGLSIVSCIPVIGDLIGKGGKLAIWAGRAVTRLPRTSKAFVQASKVIRRTKNAIAQNRRKINLALDYMAKPPEDGENDRWAKIRPHLAQVREAIDIFARNPKVV